jgi:hypothetical protein
LENIQKCFSHKGINIGKLKMCKKKQFLTLLFSVKIIDFPTYFIELYSDVGIFLPKNIKIPEKLV